MHGARQMLGSFQPAFHERLVDDYFRGDVREFAPLPRLYLLSHRLEVALHSIDPHRDAVDEGE